jgi:hypothetical protein
LAIVFGNQSGKNVLSLLQIHLAIPILVQSYLVAKPALVKILENIRFGYCFWQSKFKKCVKFITNPFSYFNIGAKRPRRLARLNI